MAQVSQVTTGTQTTIANLYISILGRNPEPAGFGFWCDNLADNGNTPAAAANIARGFANSPEFIGTYGGRTTEQAMTLMYNNVLNRAPDANGLAFWVAQANALITRGTSVGDAYALTGAAIITTAGTNSSSDTALIVSKQQAAIATGTAAPTTTFTLTTDIDVVPATGTLPPGAIVNGVINGANSTFQTGDTINGSVGSTSTVNVTVAAQTAAALVEINNVTTLNIRSLANGQVIDGALFKNVANVASNMSGEIVTIEDGLLSSSYNVTNSVRTTDGGIVVGLAAGQTAGTADVLNFSVTNSGTAAVTATGNAGATTTVDVVSAGVETYNLATSGTNRITFSGEVGVVAGVNSTTDAKVLNITGSGTNNITVGGMSATSTINASATTGANTISVGTGLTSNDVISGGSSTSDVLRATINTIATGVSVTGIETLRLDSGTAAGTIAFAANPNFTTLQLDHGTSVGVGSIRTLVNGGGFSNLNFSGLGVTADAGIANEFSGVSTTGGWTGAADALAINFSNGGVANTAGTAYNVNDSIAVNGVESITVNVANAATTATTTLAGISSDTLTSLAFISNGMVNLTTLGGQSEAITSIDYSAVTGLSASTLEVNNNNSLAAAATIIAGSGGLTVDMAAAESLTDVLTFTGGALVDKFRGNTDSDSAAFTGILVSNLGAGSDLLFATSAANVIADGGSGNDTITSGSGADSLTGGTGNDSLTAGGGNDTLVGGTGNDILTGEAGGDVLTGNIGVDTFAYVALSNSVGTTTDRITDFVVGTDKLGFKANIGGGTLTSATLATAQTIATAADIAAVYAGISAIAATDATVLSAVLVTVTAGAAAGTYVYINNNTAGKDATTDALINLTGISGTLVTSDFAFFA